MSNRVWTILPHSGNYDTARNCSSSMAYSLSSKYIQANIAGVLRFTVTTALRSDSTSNDYWLAFQKNSDSKVNYMKRIRLADNEWKQVEFSQLIPCAIGDKVYVYFMNTSGGTRTIDFQGLWFSAVYAGV
jgi:hypothetical protein